MKQWQSGLISVSSAIAIVLGGVAIGLTVRTQLIPLVAESEKKSGSEAKRNSGTKSNNKAKRNSEEKSVATGEYSEDAKTVSLATSPDPALEKSILETLGLTCNEVSRQDDYNYIRANLNKDRQPEVVAIAGGTFSGTGGADTFVFEAQGSSYQLVSHIGLSRWNPLFITERFTNGWRNLVMYAEEVHNSDNYYPFLLKFDGKEYPGAVHEGVRLSPSTKVGGLKIKGDPKNAFQFCTNSVKQETDFVHLYADDPSSRILLHSRPSTKAPDQGYGLVGDRVKVLETTEGQHNYTWYKVRFPKSGAVGWIRGDLIRE